MRNEKKKLLLWKKWNRQEKETCSFSTGYKRSNHFSLIIEHLTTLEENFEKYFLYLNTEQFVKIFLISMKLAL